MRTRAHRWIVDLAAVIAWTIAAGAVAAAGVDGALRIAAFVPLAVFLPGYAVVSALYPARRDGDHPAFDDYEHSIDRAFTRPDALSGLERVALAMLLSVVVVPAIVLGANFSPWGIARWPIYGGVAAVTIAATIVAAAARSRLPPEDRYRPPIPSRSAFGLRPRRTAIGESRSIVPRIALAASVLLLTSSVGYALVAPPEGQAFTELYVQTGIVTGETESMYPSTYTRGSTGNLTFAVANHEGRNEEYGYSVRLQRIDGAGENATVREDAALDSGRIAVADGETRNVTVPVRPETAGSELRIVVLLYRGEPPADPTVENAYRVLRLPVDVVVGVQSDAGAPSRSADLAGA